MCGIIFAESFVNHDVTPVILTQYEKQKNRGTEGFGLYDRNANHLVRSTTEHGIKKWLSKYQATSVLFHHRFPTSTDNTKNACHPFSTKDYFDTNYVLVHNGWISNAYELATAHEKLGIEYHSVQDDGRFNDSEALLWDVALYLEGKQDSLKARGPIAFICIATPSDGRKSKHLFFGRNTNPLNMLLDENEFLFLSSEGEGEPITPHQLYDYNYRSKALTQRDLLIPERAIYQPTHVPGSTQLGFQYSPPSNWSSEDPIDLHSQDDFWLDDEEDLAPLYEYKLIPKKVSYSYNTVVEGNADRTITIGNKPYNLDAAIRRKVQFYLTEAFGLYELAADLADEDYESTNGQIAQDKRMRFIEDEDLVLECDLIGAAMEVLYSSPYWVGRNSIDPGFEAFAQPQTELLTA